MWLLQERENCIAVVLGNIRWALNKVTILLAALHLAAERQWSEWCGLHWHSHLHPLTGHHQESYSGWRYSQIHNPLPLPDQLKSFIPCQPGRLCHHSWKRVSCAGLRKKWLQVKAIFQCQWMCYVAYLWDV